MGRRFRAALAAALAIGLFTSVGYLAVVATGFPIENFSSPSNFYELWKIKKWKGSVALDFLTNQAGPYLELTANDASWAFVRNVSDDVLAAPYIEWEWKADALPPGGDGRIKNRDDEAAQVYVFFPGSGFFSKLDPRIVGYTWETVPPKGTFYHSPKNDNTRVFVLRNESDPLGTWFAERRDVAKDFIAAFGGAEAPKPGAVCIQIDSDDTRSLARSAFAHIRFGAAR
jgi:hypothetical protein